MGPPQSARLLPCRDWKLSMCTSLKCRHTPEADVGGSHQQNAQRPLVPAHTPGHPSGLRGHWVDHQRWATEYDLPPYPPPAAHTLSFCMLLTFWMATMQYAVYFWLTTCCCLLSRNVHSQDAWVLVSNYDDTAAYCQAMFELARQDQLSDDMSQIHGSTLRVPSSEAAGDSFTTCLFVFLRCLSITGGQCKELGVLSTGSPQQRLPL